MIGASGAIAGMMGAYWVLFGALSRIRFMFFWIWTMRAYYFRVPAGFFFVVWIFLQLVGIEAAEKTGLGNIAHYAHLGGFAVGALTVFPFRNELKKTLAVTEEGQVLFQEEGHKKPRGMREQVVPEDPKLPFSCHYCGRRVSKDNLIAPTLLRCPNPECNRLIYIL
jgi:hypothetical protein